MSVIPAFAGIQSAGLPDNERPAKEIPKGTEEQ